MSESPSVLFVIDSDPRESHRPAEAVRIAAGIAAWREANVSVCLLGPAVNALTEWPEDLQDGGNFERYLPTLVEAGGGIYSDTSPAGARGALHPPIAFEVIDAAGLAALSAHATQMLRF